MKKIMTHDEFINYYYTILCRKMPFELRNNGSKYKNSEEPKIIMTSDYITDSFTIEADKKVLGEIECIIKELDL